MCGLSPLMSFQFGATSNPSPIEVIDVLEHEVERLLGDAAERGEVPHNESKIGPS